MAQEFWHLHSTHLKTTKVKNHRITALIVDPHVQPPAGQEPRLKPPLHAFYGNIRPPSPCKEARFAAAPTCFFSPSQNRVANVRGEPSGVSSLQWETLNGWRFSGIPANVFAGWSALHLPALCCQSFRPVAWNLNPATSNISSAGSQSYWEKQPEDSCRASSSGLQRPKAALGKLLQRAAVGGARRFQVQRLCLKVGLKGV